MLRKIEIQEEEEEVFIFDVELIYDPKDEIDKMCFYDLDEDDDETNPLYDSDPIYDTEGEEEFSEEINFLVGNEIVEVMAERRSFVDEDAIGEEIDFVGKEEFIEEVVFVEQQKSFEEIINSRTNDHKCKKISGFHIFFQDDFFSKVLREIKIDGFIDQEGLFMFHLHVRFKVWEIYTLWRPRDDYSLQIESHHKYVTKVIRKYGGGLSPVGSDFIGYNLICFDLTDYVLVVYYLTNGVFCVLLFVALKHQERLFLDDGRILHPPNDDVRENSKEVHVAELGNQKKGLNSTSCLKITCVCVGDVLGMFETTKECVLAAPTLCLYYQQKLDDKTGGVHATFNVGDLVPYLGDDGLAELRSILFQGEGNDTNMADLESKSDNLVLATWQGDMAPDVARFVSMVMWTGVEVNG